MLRMYKTVRNNIFYHRFPCCHNISTFLVCLYAKNVAFNCENPLLFLLTFIIFVVLLPFRMSFTFNFGLNFKGICNLRWSGFGPIFRASSLRSSGHGPIFFFYDQFVCQCILATLLATLLGYSSSSHSIGIL